MSACDSGLCKVFGLTTILSDWVLYSIKVALVGVARNTVLAVRGHLFLCLRPVFGIDTHE